MILVNYNKNTMGPVITAEKAKKNFDTVLEYAQKGPGVWIKKGQLTFHIHQEVSEKELLKGLKESVKEFKSGKAKLLHSLIDLD